MTQNPPNIILIVMDTARADHLSCYGHQRKTSPNIDRLASQGVLYENAFAASTWTPPSHASIFTGKYPSFHKTLGKDIRFREENTSIADVLSRRGYETLGVTCCQILGHGSGFEKGFRKFVEINEPYFVDIGNLKQVFSRDSLRRMMYGPDKGTYKATEEIESFLRQSTINRKPFFVFVNYFTCHTPYDPPRPFKGMFHEDLKQSRLHATEYLLNTFFNRSAEKIKGDNLEVSKLKWIASGGGGLTFSAKRVSVSEEEWEIVKAWYDGQVAYLDNQIGRLIRFLQDNDVFDNTVLIVTSDHGENFGDHGLAVHPLCLYDSLLRVPLIISCPSLVGNDGRKIPSLVSHVDLFPTLVNISGAESFEGKIQGKSLFPFEDRTIHDFVCAEYGALHAKGFGALKAWNVSAETKEKLSEIDKGCKCIRTPVYKYILWSDREELYNIDDDPHEEVNVVKQHSKEARALRKQLEGAVDVSYFGPKEFPKEKKGQIIDRLKALGYI